MSLGLLIGDLFKAYGVRPFPLEKPHVIQFPVNDICNARCQMCHIWKQKLDTQITPEQLLETLENPLFSKVRAVGLNGGEPTLRKDLPEIADALYRRLPRLKTVSLITNGLVAKRVSASIDALGEVVQAHGGWLDVMVSADGVGDVHDKVRGREGNFRNVETVLQHIKDSRRVNSYQLACTVVRDNVYGLHDLLDWAIERETHIKYRLAVPHGRLYTDGIVEPFALDREETYHLAIFLENLILHYERSPAQQFFYRSLIDQLVYREPRKAGCNWQHRGVTLTARGDLAYCAVASDELGSATGGDAQKIYFQNRAHLESILADKCADCRHDYGGLPAGPEFLKQCLKEGANRIGLETEGLLRGRLASGIRGITLRRERRQRGLLGTEPKPAASLRSAEAHGSRSIMICGWYGTETLGDKAILLGLVNALEQALGPCELSIVSLERYISEHTLEQLPELAGVTLLTPAGGREKIQDMDLLVFGGGPLMAINAMTDMLQLFHLAALHFVPTVLAAVGVGPMGHPQHNDSIRRLLKMSSLRIFRDQASRERACDMGAASPDDAVAEDPACSWFRSNKPLASSREPLEAPRLLLALRDWPAEQYSVASHKQSQQIKRHFEHQLIEMLRGIVARRPDLQLIPFPMCTHHRGGDDRWFYRRLLREAPDLRAQVDDYHLTRETDPRSACDIFAGCDGVLSMRFHSLLLAAEMDRPALALDYTMGQGKISALADKLGADAMSLDRIDVGRAVAVMDGWLADPAARPAYARQPAFPETLDRGLKKLLAPESGSA